MTTTPDTERRERIETAIRRSAQKKYYETDSEYYAALTDAVIAADQDHDAEVRDELKERKATLGALVEHWRGLALDRAATIARLRTEAAEVRAAAYAECADLADDINGQCGSAKPCPACAVREDLAGALRDKACRMAAAARPDDTTGA